MDAMPAEYENKKTTMPKSATHFPILCNHSNSAKMKRANAAPITIMLMARIGKVFNRTLRRPFASITVMAITVPNSLTKLSGRDRITAAISSFKSLVLKPASAISVGPYCTAITIPDIYYDTMSPQPINIKRLYFRKSTLYWSSRGS